MDEWMDRWMNGWMGGWMDGWMDGLMDAARGGDEHLISDPGILFGLSFLDVWGNGDHEPSGVS